MKYAMLLSLLTVTAFAQAEAPQGFSPVQSEYVFSQTSHTQFLGEVANSKVGPTGTGWGAFIGNIEVLSHTMIRLNLDGKLWVMPAEVGVLSDGSVYSVSVSKIYFAKSDSVNMLHGELNCALDAKKAALHCYQTNYVRNGTIGL